MSQRQGPGRVGSGQWAGISNVRDEDMLARILRIWTC